MSTKWQIVILISLGLITRFAFFGHPNETVFDEVHFGKFVSGYYTREYFFDIHPPLGKIAIAGFAKLFNFKPEFAFGSIGDKFPDKQYMILRFLPSLAGALLPLILYLLLMEMGFKPMASLLGGLLIVFENAILTQSHYILLDSFLLLFGFMGLLFYFKYKNSKYLKISYLILFGLFAGLSLSVKWTGLSFLGLPLVVEALRILRTKNFKAVLTNLLLPIIIAVVVYFSIFAAHLIILNKSGAGDAFMTTGFQKTLIGSQYADDSAKPSNIFQKFIELNSEMYKANQRLDATHPYSSQWYSWPFMSRPIYYWVDSDNTPQDNGESRIYLLGNPIIWWLSTMAVLLSILLYVLRIKDKEYFDKIYLFLLGGYVVNMLPFVGVKRVMFLYHYFTAYIFAIMIAVWMFSKWLESPENNKKSEIIFGVILAASVIAFIFFAPLSYGLNLSPSAYEMRMWFSSWK